MSNEKQTAPETEEVLNEAEETATETPETETTETEATETEAVQAQLSAQEDKYLRLAAEYDNYRKRTAKEKETLWTQAKADTVAAFLPVYDNLERAVNQACADEAYAKGVEMTMNQLKEVFTKLGVEQIPALGEAFDPNLHNAVMHVEDDSVEDNTIVEVFQQGFRHGDKVIRFAMVKVAN